MKFGEPDLQTDFSSLEVIGTYQKSGAITIYEAGLTYEFVDTVTRLEDVFRIKIGNDTVYTSIGLDENDVRIGQYADFDWTTLQPGYHQAIIEKDFANTALDYRYEFRIAVIDKNAEYHLSDLTVDISNMKKKTYLADETLDLTGLVVKGTYHADAVLAAVDDYEKVLLPSEYTVTPAEGYELTTDVEKNIKVTVSANDSDKSAEFEITVKPSCYVTFNYGYKQEIVRIEQDTKIEKPEPVRYGYEFKGWCSNPERTELFNFNTNIENDKPLYAKWSKNKPFVGAIVYEDETTANKLEDAFIFVHKDNLSQDNVPVGKAPIGIVFVLKEEQISKFSKKYYAKIVHMSQCKSNIAWCSSDAKVYKESLALTDTSDDDGSGNWDFICKKATDASSDMTSADLANSKYPVFWYVNHLTNDVTSDKQKWYLPAKIEVENFPSTMATINGSLEKLKASNTCNSDIQEIISQDEDKKVCYWSSSSVSDVVKKAYYNCPANTSSVNTYEDMTKTAVKLDTNYDNNHYVFRARAIRKCYYQKSTTGDNLYEYE
ncbi:MAG: InlB B-repeat-containing protein [Spirochaetales bacterium]|nr:InlB B-repeat-containing protein [Spirochaetales bacterium]